MSYIETIASTLIALATFVMLITRKTLVKVEFNVYLRLTIKALTTIQFSYAKCLGQFHCIILSKT